MPYDLIPVFQATIGPFSVNSVNARELHTFLNVNTQFKDWIARRIEEYDFQENSDFCSFLSESTGGRPSKEYYVTLDMAKELAMVERNEKGKQARQYFIDCEKRLKGNSILPFPAELPIETGMRIFKTANDFAKSVLELNSNHAKLSADICCKKSLNLSVLEYFGQTYLLADPRGKTYTPTELGHFYEPHFSGRSMNLFLECSGLQLKEVTTKSWVPTEKAKGFYEWADTSKQHHSGAPIKQLRWFAVVLDEIIPSMLSAIEARHAIRKAA